MKSHVCDFWRPSPIERAAITRGNRKYSEWYKRVVAEAEAERRAELERRPVASCDRGAA